MTSKAERKRRALKAMREIKQRIKRDRAAAKRRERHRPKTNAEKRGSYQRRKEMKIELYELCQQCAYCGWQMTYEESTLDHVIPLSKGGSNTIENIVLACRPCNEFKGDRIMSAPTLQPKLNLVDEEFGKGLFDDDSFNGSQERA